MLRLYSLVPKESNVTLVPHITLIRPNTLSLKGAITLFWVNTKRKTVMTLIRIVLLSNGCAVITLFRIYQISTHSLLGVITLFWIMSN